MPDQAHELRVLVQQSRVADPRAVPQPAWMVLAGAREGVGTSSVALSLAVRLAQRGRRTVLAQADPEGGPPALVDRSGDSGTLADVLAGRRKVGDVLQPGPGGIEILPGAWGLHWLVDVLTPQCDDWIDQLAHLDPPVEVVVCDAGSGPNALAERLWQTADHAILVTASDSTTVMSAYGLLKQLTAAGRLGPVSCLVNRVVDPRAAHDAQVRLATAARRFLGIEVRPAGCLPEDPRGAAAASGEPVLLVDAPGESAQQLELLVEELQ